MAGRDRSRTVAQFDVSLDKTTQELRWEIERVGGTYPLITHNKFAGGRDQPTRVSLPILR
jgi:hypothetical protein